MIRHYRGSEPQSLVNVRNQELLNLRNLGRVPTSDDIEGYKVVAEELWRMQHHKCCYCEMKIPQAFNDVEHYRPKARANRFPGSTQTHGYWWLAFNWDNLMYACPRCNRSNKNDRFPLSHGDTPLQAEQMPPGQENPLLLDPMSAINPMEHIQFVYTPIGSTIQWWARPRQNSQWGLESIKIFGLNAPELLELRSDHVQDVVQEWVNTLSDAIQQGNRDAIQKAFTSAKTLFKRPLPFAALSYDALQHFVPNTTLSAWNLSWPSPAAACP